jgi:hypothetical protein
MVCESKSGLANGDQPVLLMCYYSTHNPGPNSEVPGSNQQPAAIARFSAVLFDNAQFSALQSSPRIPPSSMKLWSGREVEYYDLQFPTNLVTSAQADGSVQPSDQFRLEVVNVVLPAEGQHGDASNMLWTRDTFAVAASEKAAPVSRIRGYGVPAELQHRILTCLQHDLGVDVSRARTLPRNEDEIDWVKEGMRLSNHPLHETFIGPGGRNPNEPYYLYAAWGSLVADLDEPAEQNVQRNLLLDGIERVQRVFTMPWDKLERQWREAARLKKENQGT